MHPCDTRGGKDGAATSGVTTVQQQAPQLPEAAEKISPQTLPNIPEVLYFGVGQQRYGLVKSPHRSNITDDALPGGAGPPFQLVAAISSRSSRQPQH